MLSCGLSASEIFAVDVEALDRLAVVVERLRNPDAGRVDAAKVGALVARPFRRNLERLDDVTIDRIVVAVRSARPRETAKVEHLVLPARHVPFGPLELFLRKARVRRTRKVDDIDLRVILLRGNPRIPEGCLSQPRS